MCACTSKWEQSESQVSKPVASGKASDGGKTEQRRGRNERADKAEEARSIQRALRSDDWGPSWGKTGTHRCFSPLRRGVLVGSQWPWMNIHIGGEP